MKPFWGKQRKGNINIPDRIRKPNVRVLERLVSA